MPLQFILSLLKLFTLSVNSRNNFYVQISGELEVAKEALIQITSRLRANVFDREGAVSALMPVLPYVPVAPDAGDRLDYDSRDGRRLERGNPYPGGYGSSGLSAGGYSPYGAPVCLLKGSITCCFQHISSQLMTLRMWFL